jgi:BirA family biotin operon repressor/biotin-[acetyl-CoA-carboxylase] ligase
LEDQNSATISLGCALAVASVLREKYGVNARIKWPNDVVVDSRKICGILSEGEFIGTRISFVVLGVGMNVLSQESDFPVQLRSIATSLKIESDRQITRTGVLVEMLEAIEREYIRLCGHGFGAVREDLLALSLLVGRVIRIVTGRGEIEGTAVDIDSTGALIVRRDNGSLERIIAGDVVRVY